VDSFWSRPRQLTRRSAPPRTTAGNNQATLQAVASFNAAVDSAYNQYQATFEAALVAARSGFASVQATLDAVTALADQAWDALATAYNSTERNA